MRRLIPATLLSTLLVVPTVRAEISYQRDIRPIFEHKCVACHACYDAPCQLILTHPDGLRRGASKLPVYNAKRLQPAAPTRLHSDAQSEKDWREMGFHSILQSGENSPLAAMIALRDSTRFPVGKRLPDNIELGIKRKNTCPTADEIDAFQTSHPHAGMPFAAPPLTMKERQLIERWLQQGATIDQLPAEISPQLQRAVRYWEDRLNDKDPQRRLVARWLFEHLFMAHLYFSDPVFNQQDPPRFFRLVRSRTPSGTPIEVIATRRPNDETGAPFYYRLQAIEDTIVFKTHITFALNATLAQRIDTLFFSTDWKAGALPAYGEAERTNPFQTFAAIPAKARYQFMLDHIEYFIRTFIRGPVCHGQIATDVIRDRFWVIFQHPDSDAFIFDHEYRRQSTPLLDITGIDRDLLTGAKTWLDIRQEYQRYNRLRRKTYERLGPDYAAIDTIWQLPKGVDRLTVFRHFDNASVVDGFVGTQPDTFWWMDFPLLERGYYNLVVNFDVFGSIAHQAQTRFYFDLIRNDAERNFLRLMPAKRRQAILDDWYQNMAQLKLLTSYQQVSTEIPSGIEFNTSTPRTELLRQLQSKPHQQLPCERNSGAQPARCLLERITALPASELAAVEFLPEVSLIRVVTPEGSEVFTLFRDRAHSNVAFLFGENLRWQPERDRLTLVDGMVASYPNFVFDIERDELADFVNSLQQVNSEAEFRSRAVQRWGVRRSEPRLWNVLRELYDWHKDENPVEAGLLDIGRYQNL